MLLLSDVADAIDNGLGLTPPMGWRHWKAFAGHIDQEIMERMQDEMVKKYPVDGVPTSLKDLGYVYVGLDDHWQNCTVICPNGTVVPSWNTWHSFDYTGCKDGYGHNVPGAKTIPWYEEDGTPLVDEHRFPDMKGMVDRSHRMGLRSGWYFGNYQCRAGGAPAGDDWTWATMAAGSVKAIKKYGFDSVKLDSGVQAGLNQTLWAELLNATGRPVMIENCHQGGIAPGTHDKNGDCTGLGTPSDCPYNFWRTTGDPYPSWSSIMSALNTLRSVANPNYGGGPREGAPPILGDPPMSRPGAWAYANTMTLGHGGLNYLESQVHMGAWCIVSSPLILAYNLSDTKYHDLVWETITNKEAIQVNQIWDGHPGRQVLHNIGSNGEVEVWTKPVGEGRLAVLVVDAAPYRLSESLVSKEPDVSVAKSNLNLVSCDIKDEHQQFELIYDETGKVASVKSVTAEGCLEVNACKTGDHARVDTSFGCKKFKPDSTNACDLNNAWNVNENGTITSVMNGKCLESASGMELNTCDDRSAQHWSVSDVGKGRVVIRQANGDGCLADAPEPSPPTPPPTPAGNISVTLNLQDLGVTTEVGLRDIWGKRDLGTVSGTLKTELEHHGSQFFVLVPAGKKWPIPFEVADWLKTPVINEDTITV